MPLTARLSDLSLLLTVRLAFVVGTAVVGRRRIVPAVVQTDSGRYVVVEGVAGADAGMSQRFAQVKEQPAGLVEVLVVVNRNDLGAQQRYETAGLKTHARSDRRSISQVVLRRIDELAADRRHVRVVRNRGNRVRDLTEVDVGHKSNRSIALDVQVALRELKSVLVPGAERVEVGVRLIEVMLVARINQRVDADTKVVRQVFLDVADILFDQAHVLADRGRLRTGRRRRCDGDRLLYLLDLAGCVVGLLLQIADLAGQRVEPLLLAGAGDDGGCGHHLVVMFLLCRCRWICGRWICRPSIRVAQQSNHCDAGD